MHFCCFGPIWLSGRYFFLLFYPTFEDFFFHISTYVQSKHKIMIAQNDLFWVNAHLQFRIFDIQHQFWHKTFFPNNLNHSKVKISKSFWPIQIIHTGSERLLGSNEVSFTSDGSNSTFRVMFKEPIEITSNANYTASATLKVNKETFSYNYIYV